MAGYTSEYADGEMRKATGGGGNVKKNIIKDKSGNVINRGKTVENKGGKTVKKSRQPGVGKIKQVSKNGVITKTVTKTGDVKHVEKERGKKRIVKSKKRI